MTTTNLLYGSQALTDEEEAIRQDLLVWAQERLDMGARPVPLFAALTIVARDMGNPADLGLTSGRGPNKSYRGAFDMQV